MTNTQLTHAERAFFLDAELEAAAKQIAELEEELNTLGDVSDGELLAYVRKFYQKNGDKRPGAPGGKWQPPHGGNGDRGGG